MIALNRERMDGEKNFTQKTAADMSVSAAVL